MVTEYVCLSCEPVYAHFWGILLQPPPLPDGWEDRWRDAVLWSIQLGGLCDQVMHGED